MTYTPTFILGMRVDPTSYSDATICLLEWARTRTPNYVCVATVHMVMEAYDSPTFRQAVCGAGLVTPDGMPLVWSLRLLGHRAASRVYGPDLTPIVLQAAARNGIAVGFYGGSPETLQRLTERLRSEYPELRIVYTEAPPFRPLTDEEDAQIVDAMRASGVQILFVGLGCPKQEKWMADHYQRVGAVMLGVGAAFDFLSGAKPQAPRWMMRCGLEWLFRLSTEPRRLWRRYLKQNPRFMTLFALELVGLIRPTHPTRKKTFTSV